MTKTTRYAANTAAAGLAAIALGLAAPAGAYTVSGTLFGDPRGSPTGLEVIVTVEVGDSAMGCSGLGNSCSYWTVDLDMAHDQARLHEFYFNLGQVGEEDKFTAATFSNFDPGDWTVTDPATEQGGGNWDQSPPGFLFEANGDTTVTNDVSLTFNMTLDAGDTFDIAGPANDFVGDNLRLSDTTAFSGEWQMGAHLGGIGANGQDSGFAVGKFNGDTPPPPPGVPEPGTMALFGLGLVGLRLARRRWMV